MQSFRLVIAGVGGQGTLLASRLLAQSAISAALSVKIGETYGMAQRGGPVMSHVQMGGEVSSPQICPGEADVLLGFEEGEAVRRGVSYLKKGGLALVNSHRLPPVEVISGMAEYPSSERLMALLSEVTGNIVSFDSLPFQEGVIVDVMRQTLKPAYYETNMKALELGKKAYRSAMKKD